MGNQHQTGLESQFIQVGHQRLRLGYTTGSCAAAAAKAAAAMLLGKQHIEEIPLLTPKGILLHLLIEEIKIHPDSVICAVRKDGGDDIDATDRLLIFAKVSFADHGQIRIDGGEGVGRITKKGLDRSVGEAAINTVPRSMIQKEVSDICQAYGYQGGLDILIFVPEGREAAKKTFNERLGILGGISILGTSGIVFPMSQEALISSIRLELSSMYANGGHYLVMTPGNYGAAFAEQLPELPTEFSVKFSNFIGKTLEMAVEIGIKGLLIVGHIGKMIKLAGGIMNTHSQEADCRMELFAGACIRCGCSSDLARKVLNALTTEAALELLRREDPLKYRAVCREICDKIDFYLKKKAGDHIEVGCILFCGNEKLGETGRVAGLIRKIQEQSVLIQKE